MNNQSVLRVRRRAVELPAPKPARNRRRQWVVAGVMLLVTISILALSAFAMRANFAPAASPGYWASDPSSGGSSGLTDGAFDGDDTALGRSANFQASMYVAPSESQPPAQSWDRMIIRTANLGLTVKDVMSAVDRVNSLAVQHGGYVFSSESRQEGDYTYATITIYVPAQEFDVVMPLLRKLDGQVEKVTSENVASSDVTEEHTDLQSQLRNLQATEVRMLDLQSKAETLADVMAVDRELRTVQGDIERIQGRINFLDKRTDMSTITIQLSPVAAPAPLAASGWQPLEAAAMAWNASLDLLGKVGIALITVGIFLWWALPLALVAVWLFSRARKKPVAAGVE